jgi:hypothetical protein
VLVFGQDRTDEALDRDVLALFADYPRSNDLNSVVYTHARRMPMDKTHTAFYSTWFFRGNLRVPMATIVGEDGRVSTYPVRNSEVDATRSRWKRLPDIDVPPFLAIVKTLPETMSGVALGNVVIVSFRTDGKWQTRLYDRAKPPKELVNLYRLAHAPLDAN